MNDDIFIVFTLCKTIKIYPLNLIPSFYIFNIA